MRSLEDRLVATKRRPAGFDYMRIGLALLVVLMHTVDIAYGGVVHRQVYGGVMRPFHALVLPMFFALSGFLVAGSLERCRTLVSFLGLRLLRIVPALAVETLLSALLLGPLFTRLPLADYLHSSGFHVYFLNIIGDIHYNLPGVFEQNPTKVVNGQLWTLPYELCCYLALSLIAFLTLAHRPKLFIPLVVTLTLCATAYYLNTKHLRITQVSGTALVLSFLWGVALYLSRTKIPWSGGLAAAAAALTILGLAVPGFDCAASLPGAYLTAYLGLLNPRRNKVLFSGDYSYGVFLYGFPIQQAVVALAGPMSWWENLALSLPLIGAWAALSWWLVEKPALSLRGPLLAAEDLAIRMSHALPLGRRLLPFTGAPQTRKAA